MPTARPVGRRMVVATGAVGAALLVYLVARLGPTRIASQLHGLSGILPAVLAITALKYPLQAAGWRLALPAGTRPGWWTSIRATIAGDALGYLTWAGPVTGEPVRALLIRETVPVATGIAAGAAERILYNLTAASLVWLVVLALLAEAHPIAVTAGLIASLVGGAAMVAYVRAEGRRVVEPSQAHATPTAPTGRVRRGARAVNDALARLWATRRQALPAIALFCVVQHLLLVGEAYLMLRTFDADTTIRTAFVFEAVTKVVNTIGLVVPARVGVSEGGSALLADALGYTASHGLSLALMRRVRAIIWAGVGLALLPFPARVAHER